LASYLLSFQEPASGGWPFRFDETSSPVFAFYPSLALARVYRGGFMRGEMIERPMTQLVRFHRGRLAASDLPIEERILSLTALEVLIASLRRPMASGYLAPLRGSVTDGGYDSDAHRLILTDRTVVANEQPMWHATLWSPLLYICLRRWASPMHPTAALVAGR
jgi:hypothetical protein